MIAIGDIPRALEKAFATGLGLPDASVTVVIANDDGYRVHTSIRFNAVDIIMPSDLRGEPMDVARLVLQRGEAARAAIVQYVREWLASSSGPAGVK